MATDKNILKNWFKNGLRPKQSHFWAWLDAYWHKDELIEQENIRGLASALDGKADTSHTHSGYATVSASNLTEGDLEAWKTLLGISFAMSDAGLMTMSDLPFIGTSEGDSQAGVNAMVDAKLKNIIAEYDDEVIYKEGDLVFFESFGRMNIYKSLVGENEGNAPTMEDFWLGLTSQNSKPLTQHYILTAPATFTKALPYGMIELDREITQEIIDDAYGWEVWHNRSPVHLPGNPLGLRIEHLLLEDGSAELYAQLTAESATLPAGTELILKMRP